MEEPLKMADFDKRGPQLERGLNHTNCIVNDAYQIVLEEVRVESIEGFFAICGEHAQRVCTFLRLGCLSGL